MHNNEYQQLMDEIEKIKFHNRSIITLIGLLSEEAQPKTQETVVTFDLSKNDLREFTTLIKKYDGNNFALEQKALKINPVFNQASIIAILKSLVASEMFADKSLEILKSYEKD